MLHRRHMPIYLVVVWVALDLLLFIAEWWQLEPRFPFLFVLVLMIFGQFAALSGWVAIGSDWINATLGCIAILPCLMVLLWLLAGDPVGAVLVRALGVGALFLYGGMLNVPLAIARSHEWGLHFDPRPRRDAVPFYQFSLREIMLYTLLVAVVAGLWSGTRPAPTPDPPWIVASAEGGAFLLTFLFALPIPWSIWAAFFWARPIHGGLVAMLVMSFWSVLCVRLLGINPLFVPYTFIPPGVLTVHILSLQLAGFRFTRNGPFMTPPK